MTDVLVAADDTSYVEQATFSVHARDHLPAVAEINSNRIVAFVVFRGAAA